MVGLISMDFPWRNYAGRVKNTDLTEVLLPSFKKYVLKYPREQREFEWMVQFLEEMDEEMALNYTKEHEDYLKNLSEQTLDKLRASKLRQEIEDSDIYIDNKTKEILKIEELDVNFKIEDVSSYKAEKETETSEISILENLSDDDFIKNIFKKYITETKSDKNSFSLKLEFSDKNLKIKNLKGETIKRIEETVSPALDINEKMNVSIDTDDLEFKDKNLKNMLSGRKKGGISVLYDYIGESPKIIKDFIFDNKQLILEDIPFPINPRNIYDIELEFIVTFRETVDKVSIKVIILSEFKGRIFLEDEKVDGKNLLEVKPEKTANLHLSNYFKFIRGKLNKLERAVNNIPEGLEN